MFGSGKRDAVGIVVQALRCALYVTEHPGSSGKTVATALNISHSTVIRAWQLLRQLGVDVYYFDSKKGFIVKDWGVFDHQKIQKIINYDNQKKGRPGASRGTTRYGKANSMD